ncbi:MAG: CPBP family intramembrane metalloprotease [Coriobacteriia bacterium]|nr:CPBP family intramembrane metalloprotease [Coriobacteriia bacterium]
MDSRKKSGLAYPIAFAAIVLAIGATGRLVVDAGRAQTADGTLGKLMWVLAPFVLGIVFRRLDPLVRGEHLFRLSWERVRVAAIGAGLTALATAAAVGVGLALGATSFSATTGVPATLVGAAIGVMLFAFFEESAWRGYLLPGLLGRTGYWTTIAITSVVWWAWHLPYLDQLSQVYTTESPLTIAPRLLFGVVAMQILYTEVFLRCRSVWPAFAIHATFNLVANLAFLMGLQLQGSLGWALAPAADSLLLIVGTAAVGLLLYRRRAASAARTATDAG